MQRSTSLVLGIVAILAAAGLALAAELAIGDPDQAEPRTSPALERPAIARVSVPKVGECGDHRRGSVTLALCSDPAADVVVADRLILGDPQTLCPLFDRASVLATTVSDSIVLCWVPEGGGPQRRFGPAAVRTVRTQAASLQAGTCGDVHDLHVHAPLGCDDRRADGVLAEVLDLNADPASCPSGTVLATLGSNDRWLCWTAA
jgi:hypothetical protein